MRILFTGISGLIGRYFLETNPDPRRFEILGTSRNARSEEVFGGKIRYRAAPFSDRDAYLKIFQDFRPEIVINAGSEGNVDVVEKNAPAIYEETLGFTRFLMEQSQKAGARFVQFSSNAVYDGDHAPYAEGALAAPKNKYGQLKSLLDEEVRKYPGAWMIIRPHVAYGWNYDFGRANPVTGYVKQLREGKELKIVTDMFDSPVYAGDVAQALWSALQKGATGEFNVGGSDQHLSRFDWVKTVAQVFGCDTGLLKPASIHDFASLAPRPRDSSFDSSKVRRELGVQTLGVKEGAERMLRDRFGS